MTAPAEIPAPYGADLWLVARVEVNELVAEHRTAVFEWLTGLGIAYRQCRPYMAISRDAATKQHLLHLSRFVLDAAGAKVIDHAANVMHIEPVVYAITDYPAWLVEVSQQQQKEREARHVGASSGQ